MNEPVVLCSVCYSYQARYKGKCDECSAGGRSTALIQATVDAAVAAEMAAEMARDNR